MKPYTEYLYSFPNASITLRIVEHLRDNYQSIVESVIVINLIDRWLIKVKLSSNIGLDAAKNLQAFWQEMGVVYQPSAKIIKVLEKLEAGESPTKIMNHYQVVIVTCGKPEKQEIEIFRDQIVERLGYCPQNMA
ncbi:MAG: hypothetical protein ACRC2S_24395 [Waterburya sp.]